MQVSNAKKTESPRRQRLARMVAERGFVRVTDAAAELGVSEVTLRSDLAALETAGLLQRVHGGAVALGAAEPTLESSLGRDAAAK
ncbi:MAG TPA: DeoR family transcriptional regulator, partial [Rhodoglobus sp.]|nr:DeoR family transcriptional regulator [Rhodoglobus sp.]